MTKRESFKSFQLLLQGNVNDLVCLEGIFYTSCWSSMWLVTRQVVGKLSNQSEMCNNVISDGKLNHLSGSVL